MFDDILKKMITFTAFKISKYTNILKFKLIVHHTLIFCIDGNISTNSPEGIHQDGMDFIMSAFIVERKNIKGAKSIIYNNMFNKFNKILEITLKEGYGILQPDMNTSLWHEVTEIFSIDKNKPAYRSSIGFDFEVIK
ncbi:2OG-Fe dioxygenase family protein [Campylobacter geochelonis]|uniref:Uncharacterized protein conserved in bacteria n=1 Tax=Campylobacter geochelonis TaxID=1780362 RepID=A0A128EKR7_9BACT|nr:2OG-Fe dioxygenase family protein [Campylobacter geochelonis]CZE49484.1 Uncharacterized protein conserved in bacteria [Campylobacter geochelonis]